MYRLSIRYRYSLDIVNERRVRSQVVVECGFVPAVDLLDDERSHQYRHRVRSRVRRGRIVRGEREMLNREPRDQHLDICVVRSAFALRLRDGGDSRDQFTEVVVGPFGV